MSASQTMATNPSSQAIQPPTWRGNQPPPLSRRVIAFMVGWFFGWPLLVFAYNPLRAPHDPLTLLIVVPGGAIWLFACLYPIGVLLTMAEARWPAAEIGEIIYVLLNLSPYILWVLFH